MSFVVTIFIAKKPELSRAEFRAAYDNYLTKLRGAISAEGKPESISRFYVKGDPADDNKPFSLANNDAGEDFAYDLIVLLKFADGAAANSFKETYTSNKNNITDDLKEITEITKSRVIAVAED